MITHRRPAAGPWRPLLAELCAGGSQVACWDVLTRDAGSLTSQWAARRPSRPSACTNTEHTQSELVALLLVKSDLTGGWKLISDLIPTSCPVRRSHSRDVRTRPSKSWFWFWKTWNNTNDYTSFAKLQILRVIWGTRKFRYSEMLQYFFPATRYWHSKDCLNEQTWKILSGWFIFVLRLTLWPLGGSSQKQLAPFKWGLQGRVTFGVYLHKTTVKLNIFTRLNNQCVWKRKIILNLTGGTIQSLWL